MKVHLLAAAATALATIGMLCDPCFSGGEKEYSRGVGMTGGRTVDYSVFDRPEILLFLFHPRIEDGPVIGDKYLVNLAIPVDQGVSLGAKMFLAARESSTILFFHGNGEIVADYDDVGSLFMRMGINFLAVDYRGYGRSGGTPTVSAMMRDSHEVFRFCRKWLGDQGYTGPLIVMGRSLGSAPALELASCYPAEIDGLIIESGFAYTVPLLGILGIDAGDYGIDEEKGFLNAEKIKRYRGPTLVIHAERDHIIPFSDGEVLFASSAAEKDNKTFLKIPEANHNTIFVHGLEQYLKAVADIAGKSVKSK
ncbi:MAG TPA: alpha/beta hydrolase [Spirochaetota bacterium]|nr:alpha/beta hydrolase [Spirochaetota bacterium]